VVMPPDHLNELYSAISKLQVEVDELRFEATFSRLAVLAVIVLIAERAWTYLA
jgi:hypothetical protein